MTSTDRYAYSTSERAITQAVELARQGRVDYVVEYDPRQGQPYRVLMRTPGQRCGPVPLNAPRVCMFIAQTNVRQLRTSRISRKPLDESLAEYGIELVA